MKSFTPQMAWHNRDPVYSVDVQGRVQYDKDGQPWYQVATAGCDLHLIIWKIGINNSNKKYPIVCDPIADILRHNRSINVLRFAPKSSGNLLASADDDGLIYIWKYEEQQNGTIVVNEQQASTSPVTVEEVPASPVPVGVEEMSEKKSPAKHDESMEISSQPQTNDVAEEAADESDKENAEKRPKPQLITISSPTTAAKEKERHDLLDDTIESLEQWSHYKVLRGHLEDVTDICWSPDGSMLISGSVDNTAYIWDVAKQCKLMILTGHKSWVQGVAWDPLGENLFTICSDRSLRIFNAETKKLTRRVDRSEVLVGDEMKKTRLFYDYTLPSFSRRMSFSMGGEFLLVSAGVVELGEPPAKAEEVKEPMEVDLVDEESNESDSEKELSEEEEKQEKEEKAEKKKKEDEDVEDPSLINACYLLYRNDLTKPAAYFDTKKFSVAARCCPTLFKLHEDIENSTPFPYRTIFAVATQSAVLFYDTQQLTPFAYVTDIHFSRLSDIAWSEDGRLLMVSSTDGYCTFVVFEEGELGEVYDGPTYVFEPVIEEAVEEPKVVTPEKVAKPPKPESAIIKNTPKINNMFKKVDSWTPPPIPDKPPRRVELTPVPVPGAASIPTTPVSNKTPKRAKLISVPLSTGPATAPTTPPQGSSPTSTPKINKMFKSVTLTTPPSGSNSQNKTPRRIELKPVQSPGDNSGAKVDVVELRPPKTTPTVSPTVKNGKPVKRIELVSVPMPGAENKPAMHAKPVKRAELIPVPRPSEGVKRDKIGNEENRERNSATDIISPCTKRLKTDLAVAPTATNNKNQEIEIVDID